MLNGITDRFRRSVRGPHCFFFALLVISSLSCTKHSIEQQPLAPSDVVVAETEDGRQLIVRGRLIEFLDTLTWQSQLRYTSVLELPMHFFQSPGKVLIAGAGGGSVAKSYARKKWIVDVVEPDSFLLEVLRTSFAFHGAGLTIHHQTVQSFFRQSAAAYDVIIIDCLSPNADRASLLSTETFGMASSHLTQHGVLALSMESVGWHDPLVADVAATLRQSLPELTVLPIVEPPDKPGSIVLYGSDVRRDDLVWDLERNTTYNPGWRFSGGYQKAHAWDNHFIPGTEGGTILKGKERHLEASLARISDSVRNQPRGYLP